MADHDDRTRELARALTTALRDALGDDDVEVAELRRLSGGASRETWSFRTAGPVAGERPLILQRLRPGGSATGPSMTLEDRLLAAAAAAGVPVPPVVVDALAAEAAGLGAARVSAHVDGEALGPRIVRAERSEGGRRALARRMGQALAGIHGIDPGLVAELDVADPLGRVRDGLDLLGEARPALELGLRRLAANRPDSGPVGVVHGDFRVGNLLVEGDELTAVLDWELAHRGDPAEDLGWLCGRAWRFGGDREVGGVADLDDLLAGYVEAGGRAVAPEEVRWWTAAGTLLWGLICAVQARRHLDGHIRSVELATIGRRVCEAEYDLLDLVLDPAPAGSDGGEGSGGTSARQGARADEADEPSGAASTRQETQTRGSDDPSGAASTRQETETRGSDDPSGATSTRQETRTDEADAPSGAASTRQETQTRGSDDPSAAASTRQEAQTRGRDDPCGATSPGGHRSAGGDGDGPAEEDLHGRPTAAELVDAVRGHLADELGPTLEGSARFHTRVAAHALEVVERELRLGPAQAQTHADRLATLGVADEADLARRIRAGDLDDRRDVDAAVRATVVDRLRVANPDWLHAQDR